MPTPGIKEVEEEEAEEEEEEDANPWDSGRGGCQSLVPLAASSTCLVHGPRLSFLPSRLRCWWKGNVVISKKEESGSAPPVTTHFFMSPSYMF